MKKVGCFAVRIVIVAAVLFGAAVSLAQPQQQVVTIVVSPDHPDWTYRTGEKVTFQVSVYHLGNPLDGVEIEYTVRPEKMDPVKTGTLKLKNGRAIVEGGTMKEPGFLRCWAYAEIDGKRYDGCGTAGFAPEKIRPTTELPDDFAEFWDTAKAALAKLPVDARRTLLPERCTETVDVYQVSLQNYGSSRLYGVLCLPKKEGKYPALLRVPGAGIRPYGGDVGTAEKGIITLEIGIHGVPVTMDTGVYNDLRYGALRGYPAFNLDDRDDYYYKRVYLGCVRAVDYIFSLPEFDGEKLGVSGGSQGGALSIVTASLDSRVKCIGLYCPALCDVTGYLHGRAGGWPHLFRNADEGDGSLADKIETSKYYDVVNFARTVSVPAFFSWGFNDTTCPPTSMYSAYNMIKAPKSLYLVLDARHWIYPEQRGKTHDWLENHLVGDGTMEPR